MANKLNFSRGLENNLPTPVDGTVRFCTDTGSLYIDNNEERIKINAGKADQLTKKRTISLTGAVTGAVEFDGSTDVIMNTMSAMESTQLIEDSEIAYSKDLPVANVSKYATITEIGGMTRKCTNLIGQRVEVYSMNGITFTRNLDGSITANGTATNQAYNTMVRHIMPNGTYTISLSGGTSTPFLYIAFTDGTGKTVITGNQMSFTLTDDKKINYVILNVNSGDTLTNETYYIMLNKGETALPYEPYFEGLRDAKVTAVESVGANLIKTLTTNTTSGVTATVSDDGTVTMSGTTAGSYLYFIFNNTLSAGTYYMNWNEVNIVGVSLLVYNFDESKVLLYNSGKITLTTDAKVGIYLNASTAGIAVSGTIKPMLNKGSTAQPYTPYFKNTFPIPEAVQALDGYGQGISKEHHNKIVLNPVEGVKKFVKNVGKDTFDGSESGISYVSETGLFRIELSNDAVKDTSGICNLYGMYVGNYTLCPDQHIMIAPKSITNDTHVIFVKDSRFSTVEEFKAYLSSNPMQIDYRLATPIETDLSDYFGEDNLIGVEAGGTITAVNEYEYDVPFTINYSYGKNYDVVSSKKFIGDLNGIATRAISDNNGNIIEKTYFPLTGGTFTGPIATKPNQYMEKSLYGLNMNNSDIVGVNGLYFGDVADGSGEGLMFKRSDNNYDQLYAKDGKLYFATGSTPSAFGVKNTVLHSGNYSSYALPLHGIADTATKLATARTISLGGNMSGSIDFDGSGNKSFSAKIGKEWTAITTVGAYSRLCLLSGYSNWILSIQLSQSSQVSYHTYLIGIGYECGSISQIGNTGYTTYSNQVIRLGRNNATSAFVEIFNNYGYNSAKTVNCTCKLIPLSESATLNAQTYYTTYTAGESTSTVWAEITSQGKGIVSSTFYGNLTGNATTAITANKVIDSNNGREITINYSADALSNPTWLAGWNGYELRGVNRNDLSVNYATSAGSATTAIKLATARTISLTGDVTGSTTFDGSGNVSITATVADDSHNHTMNTITNATTKYVNAGTVTRKVIVNEGKNSQGYISRVALGLSNPSNAFSPAILSVGINDAGTGWTDFTFGIDGSISSPKGSFVVSSGNIDTSSKPLGFSTRKTSISWGTLADSSYTYITRWDTANSGSVAFADKDGQTSMQIDGNFYQNEGNYKVLDTSTGLQLTGGTLTGRLTASGKISVPSSGSTWVSGMTLDNASIAINIQNTPASYHPIIAGKLYDGGIWNLGTITNDIGFYGFVNGHGANGNYTDWQTKWSGTTGAMEIRTYNAAAPLKLISSATNSILDFYNNAKGHLGSIGFASANGSLVRWSSGGSATYTILDSNNYSSYTLPLSGGTLYGPLNTANGTYNKIGDDVSIGDINMAGTLGIIGQNGNTAIQLVNYGASTTTGTSVTGVKWTCTGNGTSTISGTTSGTFAGNFYGSYTGGVTTNYIKTDINLSASDNKTSGWYRIWTGLGSNTGASYCIFNISRSYNSPQNEQYTFSVNFGYNGDVDITQLSGVQGSSLIKKIRAVYKDSSNVYIDIYIQANTSYSNTYYVQGFGYGDFQIPTLISSLESGYSTYEFTTTAGCKSAKGFTGSLSGNAASATIARTLGNSGRPTSTAINAPTETMRYDTISASAAGVLPVDNNANGIITLNTHEGHYQHQLGFSSNGSIYRRAFIGTAVNTTTEWRKILDSGNYSSYALPLSGGTMTGSLTLAREQWLKNSVCGLNLNNSDVIGANGIFFGDSMDSTGEGIFFPRSNGKYDQFWAYDGVLYFASNATPSAAGSAYTILHSNNYSSYALPLTGGHLSGQLTITSTVNTTSPAGQSIILNGVNNSESTALAPGIGFHIGNKNWGSLKFLYDGSFRFYNSECNGYQPVYASTFYGNLSGNATTATKSNVITCHDVRGVDRAPTYYTDRTVTAWFNETGTPSNGNWYSGLTIKGWSNGYCAWQLASYSSTGSPDDDLWYRAGTASNTWNGWRKIPTIKTITGSGAIGTVTVANNTEYRYTGVTSLALNYSSDIFECWLSITTGSSAIAISFPSGTKFIGASITSLVANTTYEISIKNKVAIIKKVG